MRGIEAGGALPHFLAQIAGFHTAFVNGYRLVGVREVPQCLA